MDRIDQARQTGLGHSLENLGACYSEPGLPIPRIPCSVRFSRMLTAVAHFGVGNLDHFLDDPLIGFSGYEMPLKAGGCIGCRTRRFLGLEGSRFSA